LHIRYKQL